MDSDQFLQELLRVVPEARTTVDEHLRDHGEVLLHLLVADLRRLTLRAHQTGDDALSDRLLSVMAAALTSGDEQVENAIAVSFVEDSAWWEPPAESFLRTWPAPLVQEVERQRAWRPGTP